VLLDSGVRRGVDVLRALALGARAVLVGRRSSTRSPRREEGVVHVLRFSATRSSSACAARLPRPAEVDAEHVEWTP
jgi:isopentenyl diphosphate isomerase/L-lactate dehydrogenase-like FMN-dependent dehydrogenase